MAKRVTAQQRKILDAVQGVIDEAVRYENEQCTNREQRIAKKSISKNREELARLRQFEQDNDPAELERLRARVDELEAIIVERDKLLVLHAEELAFAISEMSSEAE